MPCVRDILIVPTNPDPAAAEDPVWEAHSPVAWEGGAFDLGGGITIQTIDNDEAEALMDASGPAGEHYRATRQWGQFYSFVREIGAAEYEETEDGFDAGNHLGETVALSRLVRDNFYCTEFAARVIEAPDRPRRIVPILSFENRLAYRLRNERFWLTEAEAGELAQLAATYWAEADELPGRVRRAFWHTERSSHSPYLEEATVRIVIGLEALLKTERHHATSQFTTRAPALAAELGLDVGATDWDEVYAARSDAAHGAEVMLFASPGRAPGGAPDPDAVASITVAQDVLRAAVRRAIEDDVFRANFDDVDAVRSAWPI
ncbi:MAG: hypothetical protein ACRDNG_04985 [Gaiellaceae bacterium]